MSEFRRRLLMRKNEKPHIKGTASKNFYIKINGNDILVPIDSNSIFDFKWSGGDITSLQFSTDCQYIITIDEFTIDTSLADLNRCFFGCKNLTTADLSNIDLRSTTNLSYLFYDCNNISDINLDFSTAVNRTIVTNIFQYCYKLVSIQHINKLNLAKITNISRMFFYCTSLTNLNLSNFKSNFFLYFDDAFYNCSSLEELNLDNFNANTSTEAFKGCEKLKRVSVKNAQGLNYIEDNLNEIGSWVLSNGVFLRQ